MHNFEDIEPVIEEYKGKLRQAEAELNFTVSVERPLKLKLQPRWIILFVIAVFFIECMRAAVNRKFDVPLYTLIGSGVLVVGYVVYVIIMAARHRDYLKESKAKYEEKREIYEYLQRERKEKFEEYVSQTDGKKVEFAEGNRTAYLWRDETSLTVATLGDGIEKEELYIEDINYISSDEKLSEYVKSLGEEETVDKSVPYSYIFTKNKTYIFSADSYPSIRSLLPEYELQNKIGK